MSVSSSPKTNIGTVKTTIGKYLTAVLTAAIIIFDFTSYALLKQQTTE
jgi:hypothetical protein